MVVLIIFAILAAFIGGLVSILKGNFWCTQEGVQSSLIIDHPEVSKVLRINRNWINYAEVLVENTDSTRSTYLLNTNVLFNYSFEK